MEYIFKRSKTVCAYLLYVSVMCVNLSLRGSAEAGENVSKYSNTDPDRNITSSCWG